MTIQVTPISNKLEQKQFVNLPWDIYKNDPHWVPPLKIAIHEMMNPKHPYYKKSEGKFFIAKENGKVVGRIAAFYNRAHNEFHQENIGFWGFLEAIESKNVFQELFKAVENYLKKFNVNEIRGPVQLSTNYECGLLIEGNNDDPQIMMTHNPKYYQRILEEDLKLAKAKDLFAYDYDLFSDLPEKVSRVGERISKRNGVSYRKIDVKKWDQEIETMYQIYNDAWERNWGFIPMDREEFFHSAKDLKSVVVDDLIIFCEVEGKPVGFIVALPDFNQVLKKVTNGKLFPTGLFKILMNKNNTDRVRVITLGLLKEYQVKGLSSVLYCEMKKTLNNKHSKFKRAEFSWVLEDNELMNRPLRLLGANVYKTYRIYSQQLQQ